MPAPVPRADEAFFHDLVLIDLLYVAAVHTPRRTAAALALAVVGMVPTLVVAGHETVTVAEWAAEAVLWSLVVGLVDALHAAVARPARRAAARRARRRRRSPASTPSRAWATGAASTRCLDRELSVARRYDSALSVLVGDLDDFKAVNDRHGHPAGDECCGEWRPALEETVRRPDACFRWGGDEFAVILPRTNRDRAAARGGAHPLRRVARRAATPRASRSRCRSASPSSRATRTPAGFLASADRGAARGQAASAPAARRPAWRFGRAPARDGARR